MSEQTLSHTLWPLKHSPHRQIIPEQIITFDTVADIVDLMSNPVAGKRYKACGSHWGLSDAAIPDDIAIETNAPIDSPLPRLSGLAIDLGDIATDIFVEHLVRHAPIVGSAIASDPCQAYRYGPFFVHVKAGTRIYDAYSLLDRPDDAINQGRLVKLIEQRFPTLAGAFKGPWAFQTLGGAGGQTVFGALTTGTHGGDYRQRPIADAVAAVHLVAHGGQQYWIEASGDRQPVPMADETKLQAHYPRAVTQDGTPIKKPIIVIRDSDMLDAVVVAAGRFGVVTSVVLAVVPQYCLHEHRQLTNWRDVKTMLFAGSNHHAFDNVFFSAEDQITNISKFQQRYGTPAPNLNRFLQIAVNVSPHGANKHRCGVTQRWWVAANAAGALDANAHVPGRDQRGTAATAGQSFPYEPPDEDHPGTPARSTGTFLQKACAHQSFFAGLLDAIEETIKEIITDGFVAPNSKALAALAVGAGAAVTALGPALCPALAAAIAIIEAAKRILDEIDDTSLASAVHTVAKALLDGLPRPLALMILRAILLAAFESEQGDRDYVAISYAVMDGHDYHDKSCFGDASSIEVFFDATRPDIYCAYVDLVLAFEAAQQVNGVGVTIGYVSLRYIRQSNALLAPARWPETVVLEIAEIRQDDGSSPFVDNAKNVALHPMFNAPFHWGQENPLNRAGVENIYNGAPRPGSLDLWRAKLTEILNSHDTKDGFSSAFTRQTGLEPL